MATRRGSRGSRQDGTRASRQSASRRASTSGGPGPTLAGLAVLAAVLAGGTYLYRHTPAAPGPPVPASRTDAPPEPVIPGRPPALPSVASPKPVATPGQAVSPSSASTPVAPQAPFGTSEEVFEAGARLYAANCAGCHGRPGSNGKGPSAAQFWDRTNSAGAHAVAQPVGVIYQRTAVGNLVQGMPSYGQRLTDTQLWDLALLLKSAHDDLPEPVVHLLHGRQ